MSLLGGGTSFGHAVRLVPGNQRHGLRLLRDPSKGNDLTASRLQKKTAPFCSRRWHHVVYHLQSLMPISDQIRWLPSASRKSKGYSIFVGSKSTNRATMSSPLAEALEGASIQWATGDNGKIVFRIALQNQNNPAVGVYRISKGQVFDGPLRRLGVPENHRVHFEFDTTTAMFIETKRGPRKV